MPALVISEDGRLVAAIEGSKASVNRARPPDFIFAQWQRALRLSGQQEPLQRDDLVQEDLAQVAGPIPSGEPVGKRAKRPPVDVAMARSAIGRALHESPKGRFGCATKQWCAMTTRQGWRVVAVEDARFIGAACDTADIVVTPAMLRFEACRTGAILISGKSLRRSGALEVYGEPDALAAGARTPMRIVEAVAGSVRAWERHRSYDWRTGAFDEAAPR